MKKEHLKHLNRFHPTTSSHHDGHVLGNLIIRIQAEENFKNENVYNSDNNNNNEIEKYGKVVSAHRQNTIYTYDYIQSNSEVWQALLETRLSDFLLPGAGVWWKQNEFGIEFFDCLELPIEPNFPTLHHFRSSSYKQEETYLDECWRKIIDDDIIIPIDILKVEDESTGKIDIKKVGMIHYLKDLNIVCHFNVSIEMNEEYEEEKEEFVEMNEIVIDNNDDDDDDDDNGDDDNGDDDNGDDDNGDDDNGDVMIKMMMITVMIKMMMITVLIKMIMIMEMVAMTIHLMLILLVINKLTIIKITITISSQSC